jgi:hypothetical protein
LSYSLRAFRPGGFAHRYSVRSPAGPAVNIQPLTPLITAGAASGILAGISGTLLRHRHPAVVTVRITTWRTQGLSPSETFVRLRLSLSVLQRPAAQGTNPAPAVSKETYGLHLHFKMHFTGRGRVLPPDVLPLTRLRLSSRQLSHQLLPGGYPSRLPVSRPGNHTTRSRVSGFPSLSLPCSKASVRSR